MIKSDLADRLLSSRKTYRLLESLPGILSWMFILGPIVISLFSPELSAYFILAYSLYWVYNSVKFVIYAYAGHEKLLYVTRQNWLEKLKNDFAGQWEDYYYCTIIPFATESENVIRPTLDSILANNFPNNRKIICLSSEKAIPQGAEIAKKLQSEYEKHFGYFFVTEHELQPGEIKGKSSNQNHAGRFVYDRILDLGIDPSKVLITSNDADVTNHKEYIPYLLYKFLNEGEKRHKRIYQPVPTDYSDIWEASFFTRLIVTLGVQWRLALQQRDNYRCTVYSFYSLSLKTLREIGFWDVDVIPEDERTMFNALFTYGEEFRVVPLFIPTSGRPIQGKGLWAAFKEQYIQIRRWAWGASEFANSFTKALHKKHIPWKAKALPILNQIRTAVEWSTASVLPMFGGFMPGLLNENFRQTNLAYTVPYIMALLFTLCSLLVVVIVYIEFRIAPKRKSGGILSTIFNLAQWILMPYVGLILSSVPALDAQTRLIFNKRIVYIASKKEK